VATLIGVRTTSGGICPAADARLRLAYILTLCQPSGCDSVQQAREVPTEYFTLPDPNLHFAQALRSALKRNGVSVTGGTPSTLDSMRYLNYRSSPPLVAVQSRPMSDILSPILNSSQHWFAEMLLKLPGQERGTARTWEAGLAVKERFLRALGSPRIPRLDILPIAVPLVDAILRRGPHMAARGARCSEWRSASIVSVGGCNEKRIAADSREPARVRASPYTAVVSRRSAASSAGARPRAPGCIRGRRRVVPRST